MADIKKVCGHCTHFKKSMNEEPCSSCNCNDKWTTEAEKLIYVVIGYQKVDDRCYSDIYGVFSTEELALECVRTITEELDFLSHCEIEGVPLDEFGYR